MNSIDWDNIPEGFDWVAVDSDCYMYGFKSKPYPDEKEKVWEGSDCTDVHYVKRVDCEAWRESLQHRPPKEPEIKFGKGTNEEWGPRPEKLWVGMKGKTHDGGEVILKEINTDWLLWNGDWIFCSDLEGFLESNRHVKVVEWEQPIVTCCDSEPEPDWKAKYEQLREHYAHLEAELKAQECAYNVVVARRDYMEKRYEVLRRTFNETQAELNDVYKAQSKLNKIVRIVNELDEDELECDDDD